MSKLVLIDGYSILNRAFYGVPELTNSLGLHTNAVYGFLNIMLKVLEEEQADHVAVAFDRKEPTFRHLMYEAYKGTRKPMPQELHQQVPMIKEVLTAMGVPILEMAGYEADDILGTVAKRMQDQGVWVSIISGDRDLLQLADERIKIRIPKTTRAGTEIKDYDAQAVKDEYQVTPTEFIDVKALMGDSSDNIPGVPTIGEKTATSLIVAYGSIENVYAHVDEIKPPRAQKAMMQHYDMAQMSKTLATICIDCEIPFSLQDSYIDNLYTPEAYQLMKQLEFKSILQRFQPQAVSSSGVEECFRMTFDLAEAEQVFARACGREQVGFQLIIEQQKVFAVALCFSQQEIFTVLCQGLIGQDYIIDHVNALLKQVKRATVLNLKEQLPLIDADFDCPIVDASIAGYLLNPLKDTYDYDDLARDYMGMTVPSRADLLGKRTFEQALEQEPDKLKTCLGYMAYITYCASDQLLLQLEKQGMKQLFEQLEMPVIYSLYHMEQAGIRVQRQELHSYGERLKLQIDRLEQEIYQDTGTQFNINSPKQLGEVLFDWLKLPYGKKTKTGYSTAADVLDKLAPEYPVVQKILDYRQLTKLKSTYADGLAAYIKDDNRIHGTFNQTITATGRLSSTEPNLQNIPIRMELGREIRKVFVPEPGYVFVDADYSQIELRVLAHMSGDKRLIEAYQSAQDIHAITASQVFHVPFHEVTALQRRNAKAVNFGIVYGISAFGLSEDLSISRKEAVAYIDQYFETYPGVKQFLDQLVQDGKEKGYAVTMFGRRRPLPELKSANFMQRSFGERIAMNSPIQGTAADIIKIAMFRVDQRLRKEGLSSRLILQVHDELLIETKQEELKQVSDILQQEMTGAASLSVPLEIDMKVGNSWFETK